MNVEDTISYFEKKIRFLITFLYSWLTHEGEPLGYILGVFHVLIVVGIIIIIIISHTFYRSIWLKILGFFSVLVIWIQHVILKVCILTIAEKKLTQKESPYFTIFNDILGFDGECLSSYLVVFEFGVLCGLSLEFINIIFEGICYFFK
jgi:hypothetical protein